MPCASRILEVGEDERGCDVRWTRCWCLAVERRGRSVAARSRCIERRWPARGGCGRFYYIEGCGRGGRSLAVNGETDEADNADCCDPHLTRCRIRRGAIRASDRSCACEASRAGADGGQPESGRGRGRGRTGTNAIGTSADDHQSADCCRAEPSAGGSSGRKSSASQVLVLSRQSRDECAAALNVRNRLLQRKQAG